MNLIARALSWLGSGLLEPCRRRELSGVAQRVASLLAVGIAVYHLYLFTIGHFEVYKHHATHVGTILALCFLTYSFSRKQTKVPVIDVIMAFLSLGIMAYLLVNGNRLMYERVAAMPGALTPWEIGMGVVLILLLFEASRRAMGSILTLLVLLFILYAFIGPYLPETLRHSGVSFEVLVDLFVGTDRAIFGMPIGICSTYIILFLIFAAFVQNSGAGQFFNDLALAIAGKARGGPAKVSVIGSALFGTISGSAAANVAVTGCVTIPMMKRAGFEPYFAAAVESAASTGGHIMPPVMSGVVFIMAEIVGVSYWEIVIISFIPAILYYLGIYTQVHAYAVKHGLGGVDTRVVKLPSIGQTIKKGWQFTLPIISIVGLLAYGYSPIRAALWSIPIVVVVSWFRKDTRMGIREIYKSLEQGVMAVRIVMLATALAGMMMAALFITGSAGVFPGLVRSLSGGTMLLSLLLAALFCLVLGLCLSGLVAYLLTVLLVIPGAAQLGIPLIAIHLFAIYYGSVAEITPPVGGVFFQAAALADAPAQKTGVFAARLALAGFIVPFIWVYRPGLLLMGGPLQIVVAVAIGLLAVFILGLAAEGCFLRKLNMVERVLLALGVFGFTFATTTPVIVIAGIVLVGVILLRQWLAVRRLPKAQAV